MPEGAPRAWNPKAELLVEETALLRVPWPNAALRAGLLATARALEPTATLVPPVVTAASAL